MDVTMLMSFCWCHSVDVILLMSLCWCLRWMSLCWCHPLLISISFYWYHSENFTVLMSLCWCLDVNVTMLMSICWYHSINNRICEWATIVFVCLKGWLIHLRIWPKQLGPSSLNYQLEASKLVAPFLLVVPTTE